MVDKEATPETDAAVEEASRYWNEAISASEGKEIEEKPEQGPEKKTQEESEVAPPVEEESEGESEAKEDTEPEAREEEQTEEEPDPWSEVPEALRKEHEEERERVKKFEHEARSNRGRLASLQRKYEELSRKLEETPAKDEKKEPAVDTADSIFEAEDWKKFETDFGADVAGPQKAAMRRLYEAMHSRIKTIEEQAKSLTQTRAEQNFSEELQKFNQDFHQWIGDIHDGYEDDEKAEEPAYIRYVRDNYDEIESFAQTNADRKRWWDNNYSSLTKPDDLFQLFVAFETSRKLKGKQATRTPKEKSNGADFKPEPRVLSTKRNQQLKSAGSPPPRSAPGPGSRSKNGLPDPEDYASAWDFFEAKETR